MNDDENISQETLNDPALEVRIVAVVLGEASAFEAAEIERLAREKPAVAAFKHRIEALHGFVATAVRPELAPLQLAPERRAKLLRTIGGAEARETIGGPNAPVMLELAALRKKRRRQAIWRSAIAASLMLVATLVVTMAPSRRRDTAERAKLSAKEERSRESEMFAVDRARTLQSEAKSRAIASATAAMEADSAPQAALPTVGNEKRFYGATPFGSKKTAPINGLLAGTGDSQSLAIRLAAVPESAFSRRIGGATFNYYAPPPTEQSKSIGGVLHLPAPAKVAAGVLPSFGTATPGNLAGARINTDLKDLGSSISVVTQQSLRDIGATDKSGHLSYTPSTEVAGIRGNFAGATVAAAPQARDANMADELVVLSPFEVTATEERGYMASSTLAGSRVRSSLADLRADVLGKWDGARRESPTTARKASAPAAFDVNDGFLAGTDQPLAAANTSSTQPEASDALKTDEQLSAEKQISPAPLSPEPDVSRAEISTAKEAVSTFSLHVSDVSFKLAQAALARGEMPDPSRIRPEEFYNAFDYGDPSPANSDKIACRIEQSAHPALQQRNFVRIAMKVPSAGRAAAQPLSLTLLLDTSGSMERQDRAASVQRALVQLASLLTAQDHVTLIGFARQPRLLAEALPGNQAEQLADFARTTPYTGGTNIEEALKLAGELAQRHRHPDGQNRIVLLTDGAANLGNANPAELATIIEKLRQSGVAFDACGVGTDGLDDTLLEALTRKGDGRYYVLDQPDDADAGFARQLAGAFRPAAENVKVQVRFNPARVGRYRLIGFEQHRLREEDFRNDQVDAAELAADEAAVALYQVEVLPQGDGELGEVYVRFRDPASHNMIERSWTMLHEPQARSFDQATRSLRLAGTAALLAEKLRGGDEARAINLDELAPVVNALRGEYAGNRRVQELIVMYEQLRRRSQP